MVTNPDQKVRRFVELQKQVEGSITENYSKLTNLEVSQRTIGSFSVSLAAIVARMDTAYIGYSEMYSILSTNSDALGHRVYSDSMKNVGTDVGGFEKKFFHNIKDKIEALKEEVITFYKAGIKVSKQKEKEIKLHNNVKENKRLIEQLEGAIKKIDDNLNYLGDILKSLKSIKRKPTIRGEAYKFHAIEKDNLIDSVQDFIDQLGSSRSEIDHLLQVRKMMPE